MEQLNNSLMDFIVTVGSAIISLLAAYAIYYMTKLKNKVVAETRSIEDVRTREYVNSILDRVESALSDAVDKVESTTVKSLKEVTSDGKLTEEDHKQLALEAKELADKILGEDTYKLLDGIVGDTKVYVDAEIASLVIAKKNQISLTTNKNNSTTVDLNE